MDAGVHAAAVIQQTSWSQFRAVNIDATRLAAEAASKHKARLVHISSVAVYRRPANAAPSTIDEEWPRLGPEAADHYGRAQTMAGDALWEVVKASGAPAAALPPFLLY